MIPDITAEHLALAIDANARFSNGQWRTRCPVHHGSKQNFYIRDGKHWPVCYCFGGCIWPEIRKEFQIRGLLPERKKPKPKRVSTLYDKAEIIAFVRAHERNLKRGIPTDTKSQRLYKQYQRVLCAPFTPDEAIFAHLLCLIYSAAVNRGEIPSKQEDEQFRLCSKLHYAVGGYVPYGY